MLAFLAPTFPQPAGRVYSRIAVLGRGHDVWAQVARGEGGGCGGGESEVSITLCSRVSLLLFVVRLGPSLSVVELVHTVYLRACVLDCDRLNKPPGFCMQTLCVLGEDSLYISSLPLSGLFGLCGKFRH